jgi:hypothetical protein
MQEFRPDCTINLHLESRGRSAKLVWCCGIRDERGNGLVTVSGFAGTAPRETALLRTLRFGLEQALRLRMEKIEIATDIPVEVYLEADRAGVSRLGDLQSEIEGVRADLYFRKSRKGGE